MDELINKVKEHVNSLKDSNIAAYNKLKEQAVQARNNLLESWGVNSEELTEIFSPVTDVPGTQAADTTPRGGTHDSNSPSCPCC
ncbi:MAG: hypothetical protein AAF195_04755 [Pseudomonadota bacterium]